MILLKLFLPKNWMDWAQNFMRYSSYSLNSQIVKLEYVHIDRNARKWLYFWKKLEPDYRNTSGVFFYIPKISYIIDKFLQIFKWLFFDFESLNDSFISVYGLVWGQSYSKFGGGQGGAGRALYKICDLIIFYSFC